MSLICNLLWIVLGGGFFIFLIYFFGGLCLCLTIVGIPFGLQCIKLSILGLAPFGREITRVKRADGVLPLVMNIFWIVLGGIELVFVHLVFGVLCAVTIIGLPFAKQHLKLAALALTPFGSTVK